MYTGPISITAPETVEAADTAPGYQSSPITTATYTVLSSSNLAPKTRPATPR
ncbi:MAG: hypothetical protein ACP5FH_09105 [Terracidiphilus sp.]